MEEGVVVAEFVEVAGCAIDEDDGVVVVVDGDVVCPQVVVEVAIGLNKSTHFGCVSA